MYIVIFVTAKNTREANKIASKLVADKLIACANVVKEVKSVFSWKGKIDRANEVLIVMKSKKSCFKRIVRTVRALHSYDVPEIIALPIIDGNKDYLNWVKESCKG